MASQFAKTYNSFSGVDIRAVFGNKVIGELQAISYSVTREKAPLYTMGSADARSFSRGKRGIAGTLIFIIFDRHALLGQFGFLDSSKTAQKFLSDKDDMRPDAAVAGSTSTLIDNPLVTSVGGAPAYSTVDAAETDAASVHDDQELAFAWYADQIPPFDVTLAAANEHGALAVMRIYGIEILNEGYGVSIDDIVSESQMTYVARSLVPWQPLPAYAGSPAAPTT